MTKAEHIAKRIDSTPHITPAVGRQNLKTLATGNGAFVDTRGHQTRYVFRDGSALIDKGNEWGIAKRPQDVSCWCLVGEGHDDECPRAAGSLADPKEGDRVCVQVINAIGPVPTRHLHGEVVAVVTLRCIKNVKVKWDDPSVEESLVPVDAISKQCHGGGPTARTPRKEQ
jgi:hypothetical protein